MRETRLDVIRESIKVFMMFTLANGLAIDAEKLATFIDKEIQLQEIVEFEAWQDNVALEQEPMTMKMWEKIGTREN